MTLSQNLDEEEGQRYWQDRMCSLNKQYLIGDFFICASERQRDWWLGLLEANGRINRQNFAEDHSLRRLIDVVPYGLQQDLPQFKQPVLRERWPSIGPNDKIVLWGGGLWPWLDPLTAIRALALVRQQREDVQLVFPGTRHPNPMMAGTLTQTRAAIELAQELGLFDQGVFFGEWVPYADWANVLLESDLALTLHYDTLETRLAFRSRVLEYIWAGLPTVATRGDATSDLIAQSNLGTVVEYEDVEGVAEAILRLLEMPRGSFADRFQAVRQELTWERVARPLVEFCRHPRRAPDRDFSAGGSPFYQRQLKQQAAENKYMLDLLKMKEAEFQTSLAGLQELVHGYEQGKFIRFSRWLQVKRQLFPHVFSWPRAMLRQGYNTLRVLGIETRHAGVRQIVRRISQKLQRIFFCREDGIFGSTYSNWIKRCEPDARLVCQSSEIEDFSYHPLISIITPVYNPPPDVLRATIESVLAQTYFSWEICLANGNPENEVGRLLLDEMSQHDSRIKVQYLDQNLGIAGNSNAALRMAQGEFVMLLDHDDLIAPDLLYEVVKQLNLDLSLDIIYYDEDKVSADGQHRNSPWFKPTAWSPELLLSTNYLMHSVMRK
ncbi:MAG: glycosyltransferase, partial [Candidatus Cloacimonadota bacterium]|nr:glycosyltransferase [Candidatus Cloacimonadota bacterium]